MSAVTHLIEQANGSAPPLILGVNGSEHRDGHTAGILARAMEGAESVGAKIETLHLVDVIRGHHDGRLSADVQPEFHVLYEAFKKADGFILATPVHSYSPSSRMLTLLDVLYASEYDGWSLQGKVAGYLAACREDGGSEACGVMMRTLAGLGVYSLPYGFAFYNENMRGKSELNWQELDLIKIGRAVALASKPLALVYEALSFEILVEP